MFATWRRSEMRHPRNSFDVILRCERQRASKDDLIGIRGPSFEMPRNCAAPQDDGGRCFDAFAT
jgi:hypothetical protein